MNVFFSLCSNLVNGDENLARAMNLEVIDVHDVQSRQDTEVAKKYREKEVMFPRIQEAVQCHPTGADKLDNVRMEGKVVHYSSILGGVASILAVIVTVMTEGAASPLLLAGLSLVGAGTSLTTWTRESMTNLIEIKEADSDLKEALDNMKDVREIVHKRLKNKTISRLHFISLLAEANL